MLAGWDAHNDKDQQSAADRDASDQDDAQSFLLRREAGAAGLMGGAGSLRPQHSVSVGAKGQHSPHFPGPALDTTKSMTLNSSHNLTLSPSM